MKKIASLQFWAGLFLTALSAMVLTGWVLRHAPMVQMRPNFVAMVINTAACFLLFGTALLLRNGNTARRYRLLAGLLVMAICVPVLAESALNRSLGVDFPALIG